MGPEVRVRRATKGIDQGGPRRGDQEVRPDAGALIVTKAQLRIRTQPEPKYLF